MYNDKSNVKPKNKRRRRENKGGIPTIYDKAVEELLEHPATIRLWRYIQKRYTETMLYQNGESGEGCDIEIDIGPFGYVMQQLHIPVDMMITHINVLKIIGFISTRHDYDLRRYMYTIHISHIRRVIHRTIEEVKGGILPYHSPTAIFERYGYDEDTCISHIYQTYGKWDMKRVLIMQAWKVIGILEKQQDTGEKNG